MSKHSRNAIEMQSLNKSLMLTKTAFIWSNFKNIVNYFYPLKEQFSIWIYLKM